MEFPELGAQCAKRTCNQLDFLPVRCSGCQSVFCKEHYTYSAHNCPGASADKQIPVCPLCGTPVPLRPGELPDVRVGEHIDSACTSRPALELKGKIFTNTCSMTRCRKKELVPFKCETCRQNYCLAHRNELDHKCQGAGSTRVSSNVGNKFTMSKAASAAVFRAVFHQPLSSGQNHQRDTNPSSHQTNNGHEKQRSFGAGGVAVGKAAVAFSNDSGGKSFHLQDQQRLRQEEEDLQLALALSESEAAAVTNGNAGRAQTNTNANNAGSNCAIS